MWVYDKVKQAEGYLYTVGFFSPNAWHPVKDCTTEEEAAECVHYFNGGISNRDIDAVIDILTRIREEVRSSWRTA